MIEDAESTDELIADTQLTEQHIQLALAYRELYPDEIEQAISENRRPAEEWYELYPFVRRPPQ
jgi:hypothetical protein